MSCCTQGRCLLSSPRRSLGGWGKHRGWRSGTARRKRAYRKKPMRWGPQSVLSLITMHRHCRCKFSSPTVWRTPFRQPDLHPCNFFALEYFARDFMAQEQASLCFSHHCLFCHCRKHRLFMKCKEAAQWNHPLKVTVVVLLCSEKVLSHPKKNNNLCFITYVSSSYHWIVTIFISHFRSAFF